jgi:hypothetical protein
VLHRAFATYSWATATVIKLPKKWWVKCPPRCGPQPSAKIESSSTQMHVIAINVSKQPHHLMPHLKLKFETVRQLHQPTTPAS